MTVWILVVVIGLQGAGVSSERFRFTTADDCVKQRAAVMEWLVAQPSTPSAAYCQMEQERR